MTEIIFYTEVSDELSFLTKLAEKTLKVKRKACIATRDAAHSKMVSEYLWSHQPTQFIPHTQGNDDVTKEFTSLELRHDNDSAHLDILINLTADTPIQFSSFERLVEIVTKQTPSIEGARARFKWYRDRGYDIKVHKM
ncbi:MAG: DNA polymerase III subunit chi [Burkholderiales bacterium]|jgi:DNA polymerase-3 subunit chi|nr:DNA polymerase III subunit chi [Pseudomonadota bacterium]MDA1011970.1 DNA polymerase III subunit chi [Pseudomonadota bacterium]|tara:strand:- start:438 stop:851 length:414 start_codon:yes stop_codon:yes gene_type:complete